MSGSGPKFTVRNWSQTRQNLLFRIDAGHGLAVVGSSGRGKLLGGKQVTVWLRRHRTLLVRATLVAVLLAVFVMGALAPWNRATQQAPTGARTYLGPSQTALMILSADVEPYPGFRFSAPINTEEAAVAAARRICADPIHGKPLQGPLRAKRVGPYWKAWRDAESGLAVIVLMRADGHGQPTCLRRSD